MRAWTAAVPVLSLAAAGCLASKGDIRLLQEEFRNTRSQIGMVDTSVARANEQRRQQIAALTTKVDQLVAQQQRLSDSVRMLSNRFNAFQASITGDVDEISRQIVRMQAHLGQTTKNLQETRAQMEQLGAMGGAPPAPPTTGGSAAPATPGAATLFTTGRDALQTGANATARQSFEALLTSWPQSDEASRAMLLIGESYWNEGNKAAADSVYQLVVTRYPKTDDAAIALYRRGKSLWDARRTAEGRTLLERVIKEYPNSDAARLARDFLKDNR